MTSKNIVCLKKYRERIGSTWIYSVWLGLTWVNLPNLQPGSWDPDNTVESK